MKRLFFGGSRKLGRLNQDILERADNIIARGYLVLLVDANGADRAMQQYLAEKSYPHVLVFCAGTICRNNVGRWETRIVTPERTHKDFEYYAARDKKMSQEADYGFMVWDGASKGTLNNVVNMVEENKCVLVYFSPGRRFFTLKSRNDLSDLLSCCSREVLKRLDRSLKLRERICPDQPDLSFV